MDNDNQPLIPEMTLLGLATPSPPSIRATT